MQEAIKRIKNANIDLLVPKLYNSQQTLTLLQGIVSRSNTMKPIPIQPNSKPVPCSNCCKLKSKLKQSYIQLSNLKQQLIQFNLRDITSQYQKQYQNSLRQLGKYCSTLISSNQKTISILIHNLKVESSKLIQKQQQFKLQLKSMIIPRIKQHKQIQTDNHIQSIKYNKTEQKIELNRCIYKNRLKSEESNTDNNQYLKDVTKQIIKTNEVKGQQSIHALSSITNSRSNSKLNSRRSSLEINKSIKQKQFMKIAYSNYLQSGKTRQLNLQELSSKLKSKCINQYKGQHTFKLAQNRPISISKLNKYK